MAEVVWPISEAGDGVVKEGSWCLKKWQAVRTVFYSIQTDKQQLTYKCHSQKIAIGPLVVLEAGLQLPYPL